VIDMRRVAPLRRWICRALLAASSAVWMFGIGCERSPAQKSGDVVLAYREVHGYCQGCAGFELTFRNGSIVDFRGLRACAVPGTHTYRIEKPEFAALVRAFHDAKFFDIPRRHPIATDHAPLITIGYRDDRRVHETEDFAREQPELKALGKRLRDAGRVERFLKPTPELYAGLIKTGWNVNTTGEDSQNALLCAVIGGRPDAVRLLLEHGATVSREALFNAAMRPESDILALVAPAAHLDMRGPVAAHMVVLASRRDDAMLQYLLDRGADVNGIAAAESPLMGAISGGALRNAALLLSRGADARVVDRSGQTPLHAAAGALNTGFITLLARQGVDLNARDRDGRTPLLLAAERCYDWNVRALLEAGVDPTIASNDGRTPADAAAQNRSGQKCDATRALLASRQRQP
jgi:ankyrin repeat protein